VSHTLTRRHSAPLGGPTAEGGTRGESQGNVEHRGMGTSSPSEITRRRQERGVRGRDRPHHWLIRDSHPTQWGLNRVLLIPQCCPHRPRKVRFLLEMEALNWPRGLQRAPFRPDLYTMCPHRRQSHNRSSQFSGVFCDSQALSGIISISLDSRLPLHKRTNKISRKNEVLTLHGPGCIAANGAPQICDLQNFSTNGKPVLRTVPFLAGVPSDEDRIWGSAILYSVFSL